MQRVKEHPILRHGEEEGKMVPIVVDGREMMAKEGEPVAAALMAQGIRVFRHTAKDHQPRGLFCGIGQCTDCVMEINGVPNVRSCVTPVEAGMRVNTQEGNGRWVAAGHEEL